MEGLKVRPVIDKVIGEFNEALEEREIALTTEGIDELPLIPADAELLYKVFYHVIMNAIKYTPDHGSIRVSGRVANEKEVEISIQDTGIGINPEYLELVFEKFYQTGEIMLHSSSKIV